MITELLFTAWSKIFHKQNHSGWIRAFARVPALPSLFMQENVLIWQWARASPPRGHQGRRREGCPPASVLPTSVGGAHQCRPCPGPGPHGQRQSQALGQRWLKDGAVGNPSKLSGGVTEGWLTQRETCHLLTLAAPGIFPENSYSKTHTELHWFTGKGSSKRRVITQNEKLDLLTGLSLFALHGLDFSFYSAKLL